MPGEGQSDTDIIEYPENYEDMKKKYLEREEEKLRQVMARRQAQNTQELEDISSKAISTRALRAAPDHKPLKDRTIIREAKSEDIQSLKKQLSDEINAIGQRILKELVKDMPTLEQKVLGLKKLKGRVSQSASSTPVGSEEHR